VVAKADERTVRGASEKVTIRISGRAVQALRGGARTRRSSVGGARRADRAQRYPRGSSSQPWVTSVL
jgi:hypothetical protein